GVACGLLKAAAFGVDPYQSLVRGAAALTGASYDTMFLMISGAAFLFAFRYDRSLINAGTVFMLLLSGHAVDCTVRLAQGLSPDPGLLLRGAFFAVGIILLAVSSSVYFTVDLGLSPYDCIARIMADRFHIADFKYTRIMTDGACVGGGAILMFLSQASLGEITGLIGAGTILIALCFGPLISLCNRRIAQPLLEMGR
ncbi:MAG: hypothetical protein IJ128_05830, partial [Firmicutes bacterium]|nr:hypothetical protein [Bacillota bacterium]